MSEPITVEYILAQIGEVQQVANRLVDGVCRQRDEARAQRDELLAALKLLAEETKLSGNWNAKDYGWPKAIAATIAAIAKAEGQS